MPGNLLFRLATIDDLAAIINMLADDTLGTARETAGNVIADTYINAFNKIAADPNQELTVGVLDGEAVATFQISYIQYLTYQGGLRAQVEAVRTHSAHRGKGLGRQAFAYILNRAKQKGCHMVQLATDKKRADAIRFYQSLGFTATHEGFKLHL